jgi:hypothetical protein
MHTQVNIRDVVIHTIGLGQLLAKILCPNLTPMHSLFHMRNLKFLPKFYARILNQGIVFFHMRSTREMKSNNKLGSATWVLGKKSELIWRWGILLHEHHHDITIKTKGTIFPNSVLYWKEPS